MTCIPTFVMAECDVFYQVFYLQKQFWKSKTLLDLQKFKKICDHKTSENKTKTFCQNTKNVFGSAKMIKHGLAFTKRRKKRFGRQDISAQKQLPNINCCKFCKTFTPSLPNQSTKEYSKIVFFTNYISHLY